MIVVLNQSPISAYFEEFLQTFPQKQKELNIVNFRWTTTQVNIDRFNWTSWIYTNGSPTVKKNFHHRGNSNVWYGRKVGRLLAVAHLDVEHLRERSIGWCYCMYLHDTTATALTA